MGVFIHKAPLTSCRLFLVKVFGGRYKELLFCNIVAGQTRFNSQLPLHGV